MVRAGLTVAVDAGKLRLHGDDIVAGRLYPSRIGGPANDQGGTAAGGGNMSGASVIGDNATRVLTQSGHFQDRRLIAEIDNTWTDHLGDRTAFLGIVATADQRDPVHAPRQHRSR